MSWPLSRWPGRFEFATLAGVQRLELFDQAMAIAAQLFTSVVPILIMVPALCRAPDRGWRWSWPWCSRPSCCEPSPA